VLLLSLLCFLVPIYAIFVLDLKLVKWETSEETGAAPATEPMPIFASGE